MSPPDVPGPPGCTRCHRADVELVQSPFTAEALCPDCLRQESGLLTRLRSSRGGPQAIACDHPTTPWPHPAADPAEARPPATSKAR